MSQPKEQQAPEDYAGWVRSALRQIYDASALEHHPLTQLLATEGMSGVDAAQQLRRLLLQAISDVRPPPNVPVSSPDWRAYRILELRFLDGLSASEAMDALALQKSQFFRDQARAMDRVVAKLWAAYSDTPAPNAPMLEPTLVEHTDLDLAQAAVQRISEGAVWEALDAAQVLQELAGLWQKLAQAQGIVIRLGQIAPVPVRHASRVMLRQAILNVITSAMEQCPGSSLTVSTWHSDAALGLMVRSDDEQPAVEAMPDRTPPLGQRLEISRRLTLMMHGSLQLQTLPGSPWEARLLWQARARNRLLVIDDNQGFVDLFARYLTGHGWRVLGALDSKTAWQLITEQEPTVITMDVLMPEQDGWDMLIALKTDERTRDIPVIICSVLQEPQLAFSLGASAYLPKPVSEASLMAALRPWAAAPSS